MEQSYQISWYAPNFINMCIDNINDGELSGRIYHCYSKEPWKFTNILQLIELADDLKSWISRTVPGRAALPGWKSSESSISAVPLNY